MEPDGTLFAYKGLLYGTTLGGAVFFVTPSGSLTVLYQFTKKLDKGLYTTLFDFPVINDGADPKGRLAYYKGALYGATAYGGSTKGACGSYGCGTVFKLNSSGKYEVLHRFLGTDGSYPLGGLFNVKGTFYGTTLYGGPNAEGVLYSISPAGVFSVVYGFGDALSDPIEGLSYIGRSFYGIGGCTGPQNTACAYEVTP